jgi:hypothetical protein
MEDHPPLDQGIGYTFLQSTVAGLTTNHRISELLAPYTAASRRDVVAGGIAVALVLPAIAQAQVGKYNSPSFPKCSTGASEHHHDQRS